MISKKDRLNFRWIRDLRKKVLIYVRQGKRDPSKYDYPGVAVICEENGFYGYGYSRKCHERLQRVRPQNHKVIADKIKKLKGKHDAKPNNQLKKYFWGSCAEDMAATCIMNRLGTKVLPLSKSFSKPRRVRTGIHIPMCETCKALFK